MEVKISCGVVLYRDARLAQIGFQGELVEGYDGVCQASSSSAGRDGVGK